MMSILPKAPLAIAHYCCFFPSVFPLAAFNFREQTHHGHCEDNPMSLTDENSVRGHISY
jgi:hypothetical protein